MPQLDTSTWLLVIFLMTISLFCAYQLKMKNQDMTSITALDTRPDYPKTLLPWEAKWTKIYLPPSSPLQS
uniref:ATP synthase complex subunit 8 n=1 Tax=Notoryctes typhlops TaxID=37699 RepID=Q5QRZ7_NOTTY|nr:ATP synthase F0 subunit 8 [Notoryctes typhlops]CAG26450.1 ATP synthase F0 subunit 8 [Notoryctes typhlops]